MMHVDDYAEQGRYATETVDWDVDGGDVSGDDDRRSRKDFDECHHYSCFVCLYVQIITYSGRSGVMKRGRLLK